MSSLSGLLGVGASLFVTCASLETGAAPFVPRNDVQVLEKLRPSPFALSTRELRDLKSKLARDPDNLDLALKVARKHVDQSRIESDPRFLGYAQAALGSWWRLPEPPVEVPVLRAIIRQSSHDFERALHDLDLALKADQSNAQAWLTRATILQVRGDFDAAKRSCLPLLRLSSPLIAVTCASSIASLNGEAEKSYELLGRTVHQNSAAPDHERLWAWTVLAEIAARLGLNSRAEEHFTQALGLGPEDSYSLGAYGDFLLDQQRSSEVVTLLQSKELADGLLLRLTLAEKSQKSRVLQKHLATLRDRFKAAQMRGDTVHRREQARFTLQLLNQPREALLLAQENWAVQREPADARILLESALAANNPEAAKPIVDWLKAKRLEDIHLTALCRQIELGHERGWVKKLATSGQRGGFKQ